MLIYSSTVFSYLLLAIFGDYLGRKKFMIIGLLLTIGGILISIFAVNLLMGAMGMFIGSLGTLWLYSISMLYVTETVSD
jgi:MFS family permease